MGDFACGCRFPPEMYGMRTYDHGTAKDGGKEYKESEKEGKITVKSEKKSYVVKVKVK